MLGAVTGRSAISAAAARALAVEVSSELQQGVDRSAVRRAERQAERVEADTEALTLAAALKDYVKRKRRAKDGLPLKARTVADYLSSIDAGGTSKAGKPFHDGVLYALADMPLAKITAEQIRKHHAGMAKRSKRQADYAMQILRAIMRWHGAVEAGSPLHRDTAGKDRILIAPSKGDPSPIPPDRLGAWWNAACAIDTATADMLRFMLLTGCRGIEVHGSVKYEYPPIAVADVDLTTACIMLADTKNRKDHRLVLSNQALAIVKRRCEGRKGTAAVFPVEDGRKTLAAINKVAGTSVQAHGLRSTFASIAEDLVSAGTLKRLLNHANSGDVTQEHYVLKSGDQLRAGWQAVADYIERSAVSCKADQTL